MTKKAQTESGLAIIIVSLAIAIIIIGGVIIWLTYLRSKTDVEACRLSVLGKSYSKPVAGKSPLELKCPRNYITFYNDKITSETKGRITKKKAYVQGAKTDSFKELTQDITFQVMAEELRNCWYKMGEGKLIPFDQALFFTQTNICLVCSVFWFDEKMQGKEGTFSGGGGTFGGAGADATWGSRTVQNPKIFSEFSTYLNETIMPNSEMTYGEYFQIDIQELQGPASAYQQVVSAGKRSALFGEDTFSTKNNYYLVYSALTPAKWMVGPNRFDIQVFKGMAEKPLGLLFLINADNISSLKCDMLYN